MLSLRNVILLAMGMRHSGIGFGMIKIERSLEVGILLLMKWLCTRMFECRIRMQSQRLRSLILSAWMRFLKVQLKEGIQKLMRIQKLNKILKLKKLKNNILSRKRLQRLSEGLPEPLELNIVIHPPCSIFC
jgi:hypothetical protein